MAMPETQTPPPPFGQIVAIAQRALGDVLDELLRKAGVSFERWAALNMLAARGSAPRAALVAELADALRADQGSIAEVLGRLEADGLVASPGDPGADRSRIELTSDGTRVHQRLREEIGHLTARILGGLDPQAIGTTIRTLREVTERAQSLRSGQAVSA
jgi:DNA-binding MarR family transcriptional regulator